MNNTSLSPRALPMFSPSAIASGTPYLTKNFRLNSPNIVKKKILLFVISSPCHEPERVLVDREDLGVLEAREGGAVAGVEVEDYLENNCFL